MIFSTALAITFISFISTKREKKEIVIQSSSRFFQKLLIMKIISFFSRLFLRLFSILSYLSFMLSLDSSKVWIPVS